MLGVMTRQRRRQAERREAKGPSPQPSGGPNRKARRQMMRGRSKTIPFLYERILQENLEKP